MRNRCWAWSEGRPCVIIHGFQYAGGGTAACRGWKELEQFMALGEWSAAVAVVQAGSSIESSLVCTELVSDQAYCRHDPDSDFAGRCSSIAPEDVNPVTPLRDAAAGARVIATVAGRQKTRFATRSRSWKRG